MRDVEDDEETQYGEDCNEPTFNRNISKTINIFTFEFNSNYFFGIWFCSFLAHNFQFPYERN